MTDMPYSDQFKRDNLAHIEAVGAWTVPCILPMKRYSDEDADYKRGILRFRESDGVYIWHENVNMRGDFAAAEGQVLSKHQIEQLVNDGWMVD